MRRAVYTALLGAYEDLVEQPQAHSSDVDFLCLTDDPSLTSDTWTVVQVEPEIPGDSIRSARMLKILGHDVLSGYDETLWIDNSVLLKADPADILDEWLKTSDMALPAHSYRTTVAAEFVAVLEAGRDQTARVLEQRDAYTAHSPELLTERALWTALLARKSTQAVRSSMLAWMIHVLRYSRRDQLSVGTFSVRGNITVIEIDNFDSELHTWPASTGRKAPVHPQEMTHDFATLHARIDEISRHYTQAVVERDVILNDVFSSRSWKLLMRLERLRSKFTRA